MAKVSALGLYGASVMEMRGSFAGKTQVPRDLCFPLSVAIESTVTSVAVEATATSVAAEDTSTEVEIICLT